MYELSILIPARNEQFLKLTVEDLLKNKRGKTEIIVGLDGQLADPPLVQHPDVTVYYSPVSIGQRAITKQCARLARGKYIMKLDSHCSVAEGFDVEMIRAMKELGDDVTLVPLMKNLHVFDLVCPDGHRRYQGPSGPCKDCGKPTTMDIVWKAKNSPKSVSYCFNSEPKFQYFGDFSKRPEGKGEISPTMSLQGSCFLMTKERYFALDVDDESMGSWGSQGISVAVRTWLSGGRVLCNKRTWYAHCFRTQGEGFSFPYPMSGRQVSHAKKTVRNLFFENKWPLQKHPLSWLVDRFSPVPGWSEEDLAKIRAAGEEFYKRRRRRKPTKGVIYYSHNDCDPLIMEACQKQLKRCIKEKHIISVTAEPIALGANIVKPRIEGWLDLFERILAGLEASDAELIFLAEHDCLYHPKHFDVVPDRKDAFWYNTHVWKVRYEDGFAVRVDDCKQLSGLVAYRELLLEHFRERVRRVKEEGFTRGNGFEPGTRSLKNGGYDDHPAFAYQSEFPNIDIRHGKNATQNRWSKDQFRNQKFTKGWTESTIDKIEGWDLTWLRSAGQ